jgi:hypothetical protein
MFEWEDIGRSEERLAGAGFCWMRAMNPGMLSFAWGVGWT